jgi:hypothetical protein
MLAICWKPMVLSHRRLSTDEMARRGVRLLNKYGLFLECVWCHHTWSPRLRRDHTLPRRFWECPNRCNW